MLVRVFCASAFGLRGGIPMDAAQTDVYHAPASRVDIMRSTRIPMNHPLTEFLTSKRGAPMPPSNVRECTRRTEVRGQGAHLRVEKRQRPSRHARHTEGLYRDVGFAENTAGLIPEWSPLHGSAGAFSACWSPMPYV